MILILLKYYAKMVLFLSKHLFYIKVIYGLSIKLYLYIDSEITALNEYERFEICIHSTLL